MVIYAIFALLLLLIKCKEIAMLDLKDMSDLCEEYNVKERIFYKLLLRSLKEYYTQRKIIFFDIYKQHIAYVDRKKIDKVRDYGTALRFFKPSQKDLKQIKIILARYLKKHKQRVMRKNKDMRKKIFINALGSSYIRATIVEIEEESVLLSLTKNGERVGNLKIYVPILSFFDDDVIEKGHNFLVKIRDVKAENGMFLVEGTRRDSGIIKLEFKKIFDVFVERLLLKTAEEELFKREDFAYRILDIDLNKKEVHIQLKNERMGRFVAVVAKVTQSRLGFRVIWR